MDKTLIMHVGLPGVGKSTFMKEHVPDEYEVISSDDYIEKECAALGITYNEGFQRFVKDAMKYVYARISECVTEEKSMVIDMTNLTVKSRASKLKNIPKDYWKAAVVFTLGDEDEWRRRLDSRPGKTIPENVLQSMQNSFEYPSEDEGFNEILDVDM